MSRSSEGERERGREEERKRGREEERRERELDITELASSWFSLRFSFRLGLAKGTLCVH